MTDPRVIGLRSVEFGVSNVKDSARFYQDSWGLVPVAEGNGVCHLRATGDEHHIVTLREAPEARLLRVDFATADKANVDALHARANGFGATVLDDPAPVDEPGGGYGFSFKDLDGHTFRIRCDVATHAEEEDSDRPRKLSHVVLNSEQVDAETNYFVDLLGFRISDCTERMHFIRCSTDHHSIAFARMGAPSLNHVAFEVPSFDALMRGAGRMKAHGFAVEWGVGRHGPGDNIFTYFIEPNGLVVEYTAEIEQIDEATHKPGTPEDWKHAGNPDRWGFAEMPSERVRAAMGGNPQPPE